jgi:hypothetical protein
MTMKRVADQDCIARKCLCVLSLSPARETHETQMQMEVQAQSRAQLQSQWAQNAHSIYAWACSVAESNDDFPTVDSARASDNMSDSSQLRQRRPRSCSPTKKSPQYRNTVLKPANILVEIDHTLPPDIEALLPRGLRSILDPPAAVTPTHAEPDANSVTNRESTEASYNRARELADTVSQIADVYCDECRELARKPGSEPEYRTHLYGDVVEKLARIPPWRRPLSANCSDKLWRASLKPLPLTSTRALPPLVWPTLSLNPVAAKSQDASQSTPNSLDSNIIHVRPYGDPFNFAHPPPAIELSDSSTNSTSEIDGTITTPKPDITVGISLDAFGPKHTAVLNYWQVNKVVLSDPHAIQGDMRFPFLIIEAKGLATNGNLIGAQNQAAGGGTCAIRLLESLAVQDPAGVSGAPRIVFSLTTEGAIHELWVHYRGVGDDDETSKMHMTCLGAWRTTLHRHAHEFVAVLAIVLGWGVDEFHPQIKQVMDRVIDAAVAVS